MDTGKRDFFRAIRITGIFVDMGVTAISWLFNYYSVFPQVNWESIGIVGLLIFCILLVIHIISLEVERGAILPNIEMDGDPVVWKGWMKGAIISPNQEEPESQFEDHENTFIQIRFSNNPKIITDKNSSKHVRARLVYIDADGNYLIGDGNWANPQYPVFSSVPDKWLNVDFPSDGTPRYLNLIVHHGYPKRWYAWDSTKYYASFFNGWGEDKFELKGDIVYVDVELIGERIKKIYKLKLHLNEEMDKIKVEVLHGQRKKDAGRNAPPKRSLH